MGAFSNHSQGGGFQCKGLMLSSQRIIYRPEEYSLVLVDINMPQLNGVDAVKECLKLKPDLKFIFVTAHDDYAVEAFDMFATDYVMKPVEKNRLFLALERAQQVIAAEINAEKRIHDPQNVLPIRFNRSAYYIPVNDILFIEKVDRKSVIHTQDQQFQTYETLETLKQHLDHSFYQTHRSYIIHIPSIFRISTSGKTFLAHFKQYTSCAYISRQKINNVRELLGERIHRTG